MAQSFEGCPYIAHIFKQETPRVADATFHKTIKMNKTKKSDDLAFARLMLRAFLAFLDFLKMLS